MFIKFPLRVVAKQLIKFFLSTLPVIKVIADASQYETVVEKKLFVHHQSVTMAKWSYAFSAEKFPRPKFS